jgi:hypothetical protein
MTKREAIGVGDKAVRLGCKEQVRCDVGRCGAIMVRLLGSNGGVIDNSLDLALLAMGIQRGLTVRDNGVIGARQCMDGYLRGKTRGQKSGEPRFP